jgi:DNA-binding beta-propeller fold protein YncE
MCNARWPGPNAQLLGLGVNVKQKLVRNAVFLSVVSAFAMYAHAKGGSTKADEKDKDKDEPQSNAVFMKAPAGNLPATQHVTIDGLDAAVLPNGRIVTPTGVEVSVGAPKPFGLAVSPDGQALATINSGASPFSIALITNLNSPTPKSTLIHVNATFMGIVFSPDSSLLFASGGENGNIWVLDVAKAQVVGSINLNGSAHPLTGPLDPTTDSPSRSKGTYPGNMVLGPDGRFLYVVDQGGFQVFAIDTSKIVTGIDNANFIIEPNNFAAVAGSAKVGRYPFGIAISSDGRTLAVSHVGVFQYTSLAPKNPTGNKDVDFPLGYPGFGYPEETEHDRTIAIKKVDPRNLPPTLRDPDGIRVGYIPQDVQFTVPGLGDPNVPESSSVYFLTVNSQTGVPAVRKVVKTGPKIGEVEDGIAAYSGSHPNAVVFGARAIYVSNGNNDSISILDPHTLVEEKRVRLSALRGYDNKLKGVQPVGLALSPDGRFLYVAEAGVNALGVLRLHGDDSATLEGLIPTGWWPSSVRASADGKKLYVASANGRGAIPNDPNPPNNLGSPKFSTLGTVHILNASEAGSRLEELTERVLRNNGFVTHADGDDKASEDEEENENPVPDRPGVSSKQIKHIIFINKENATHDLLLGDITSTRKGVAVAGSPELSLGYAASPNHHELALDFAFGDNFFLEPSVSSDGHNWLTGIYTTEFEQTHWPASYGGERNDSGDNPNVFGPYPGRLGFTDANSSPDPHGYNQHGGIYLHLNRNHKSFVNFGNGYEFAIVDEDRGTEPTGIRNHVNVPMEKILRDHSDHLFPEFNTAIPDGPQGSDPTRFNRFGRFKQVFESHYVNRKANICKLPDYVDLYYPNDHGGGAFDINPNGPAWDFERFVQDNDQALGLTVELVSHSPCWKDTVIFVVEDDPQNGFDHVNATRSIFLAISPWVKREYVAKTHYNLGSIFKTVNLILGLPPLNQYDAAATDLRRIFTPHPDFVPYNFQAIQFAKDAKKSWYEMTKDVDFKRPDAEEVKLREAIVKSEGLPHPAAAHK